MPHTHGPGQYLSQTALDGGSHTPLMVDQRFIRHLTRRLPPGGRSQFIREAIVEKAYRAGILIPTPAHLKNGSHVTFKEIRNFSYKAVLAGVRPAPVIKTLPYKMDRVVDHAQAGKIVRSRRRASGISARQLSAAVGITESTLFRLEVGARTWTEKRFKKICDTLAKYENHP